MADEEPWFVAAFGGRYPDVYPHRDLESARREAVWLVDHGVSGRILDLCCGFGRHTLALCERDLDVIGADLSAELLYRAKALPGGRRLASRLLRADARALPVREACLDSVVVLFSSFGYFGEPGDRAMLREIARVLRPSGLLVLDLMNPARVRAELVPESSATRADLEVHEHRALEDEGRRVVKSVVLRAEDRIVGRWREAVRLYEPDEIQALLRSTGFGAPAFHGGFDDSPFGPGSPRQIVLSRRGV